MLISLCDIKKNYEVIDTIFHIHGEKAKGLFGTGGLDSEAGFENAKAGMISKAKALGGNAIVGCDFEVRLANSGSGSQVLEIYCFGTVVKITD